MKGVYCAVRTGSLYTIPRSAHTVYLCVLCGSQNKQRLISLYSINLLVCITETECVYCAVRTGSLYIILRSAHTVYLCVLCGSENKQRLISLYRINLLVCITERKRVYSAVRAESSNVQFPLIFTLKVIFNRSCGISLFCSKESSL